MPGSIRAAHGLARATVIDTVRRPAFGLGVVSLGVLLALAPRLGSPAAGVRDNAALALELSLSTLAIAGPVVAGLLAIQATQADHDAGLARELLAAPQRGSTYLWGRWIGVATVTYALCIGAVAVGAIGWTGRTTPSLPADFASWCGLIAGLPLMLLLGASLGLVYGLITSRDLGIVCFIVHLLGARFLTSWSPDAPPALRTLLLAIPDPSRLDLAADFAFGRAVGNRALALAAAASAAQAVALMLIVPSLLRRRTRRGSS